MGCSGGWWWAAGEWLWAALGGGRRRVRRQCPHGGPQATSGAEPAAIATHLRGASAMQLRAPLRHTGRASNIAPPTPHLPFHFIFSNVRDTCWALVGHMLVTCVSLDEYFRDTFERLLVTFRALVEHSLDTRQTLPRHFLDTCLTLSFTYRTLFIHLLKQFCVDLLYMCWALVVNCL